MLGVLLLQETPNLIQTLGIVCVVLASVAVVQSSAQNH